MVELLKAVLGDHVYDPPGIFTVEFRVVDCPEQIVAYGTVIVGKGVTLIVVLAVSEEQPLYV